MLSSCFFAPPGFTAACRGYLSPTVFQYGSSCASHVGTTLGPEGPGDVRIDSASVEPRMMPMRHILSVLSVSAIHKHTVSLRRNWRMLTKVGECVFLQWPGGMHRGGICICFALHNLQESVICNKEFLLTCLTQPCPQGASRINHQQVLIPQVHRILLPW